MTVRELIAALQQYSPDMEVRFWDAEFLEDLPVTLVTVGERERSLDDYPVGVAVSPMQPAFIRLTADDQI